MESAALSASVNTKMSPNHYIIFDHNGQLLEGQRKQRQHFRDLSQKIKIGFKLCCLFICTVLKTGFKAAHLDGPEEDAGQEKGDEETHPDRQRQ